MIQAFARLEREGKLLRRFELLPRGFIAPTISYYDLESMGVPYAFPPPDDAAADEDVVFLDPDAVPDRAAVVVTPGHPRTWTLVSRTPVPRIVLALAGDGRLRVRWGLRSRGWSVDSRRATLVELAPWRGFPWFKHVYRLGLEPGTGRVAVRLLRTPCEVAERLLALEDWAGAIRQLEACRGTRWMEPARLLDLAWARARAGQPDGARAALGDLRAGRAGPPRGARRAGRPPGRGRLAGALRDPRRPRPLHLVRAHLPRRGGVEPGADRRRRRGRDGRWGAVPAGRAPARRRPGC